jgi:hypothetical protein
VSHDDGRESGQILCSALGLNPHEVKEITIRWRPGELPFAEVEMLLNERVVYEVIQLGPRPQ